MRRTETHKFFLTAAAVACCVFVSLWQHLCIAESLVMGAFAPSAGQPSSAPLHAHHHSDGNLGECSHSAGHPHSGSSLPPACCKSSSPLTFSQMFDSLSPRTTWTWVAWANHGSLPVLPSSTNYSWRVISEHPPPYGLTALIPMKSAQASNAPPGVQSA